MARELFEVSCPCCQSTLKIDAEVRAVISHAEPVKKPVIEDLAAEVQKLKGAPGRREEAFQKSFAAEKNQGQLLNRKFDELLKQAKENPDFGKKPRDIDLYGLLKACRMQEVARDLAGGPMLPIEFIVKAAHGVAGNAAGEF